MWREPIIKRCFGFCPDKYGGDVDVSAHWGGCFCCACVRARAFTNINEMLNKSGGVKLEWFERHGTPRSDKTCSTLSRYVLTSYVFTALQKSMQIHFNRLKPRTRCAHLWINRPLFCEGLIRSKIQVTLWSLFFYFSKMY